jgi:hypothetical protein
VLSSLPSSLPPSPSLVSSLVGVDVRVRSWLGLGWLLVGLNVVLGACLPSHLLLHFPRPPIPPPLVLATTPPPPFRPLPRRPVVPWGTALQPAAAFSPSPACTPLRPIARSPALVWFLSSSFSRRVVVGVRDISAPLVRRLHARTIYLSLVHTCPPSALTSARVVSLGVSRAAALTSLTCYLHAYHVLGAPFCAFFRLFNLCL